MAEILFVITVHENCEEKEFIKAVVREARLQARAVWRSSHKYVRNKGGRPKLENRVYAACDEVWNGWGGKFPKHNSKADALVQKVAGILDEQDRKKDKTRPKRQDLRTVSKYVRNWISFSLSVYEVPDSWLRKPDGRKVVRTQATMLAIGHFQKAQGNPSVVEEMKQSLAYPTDKQLVDRLIVNRKK